MNNKYIEIELKFPDKDSAELSLENYRDSEMQIIITNLYKHNRYVTLNTSNTEITGNDTILINIDVDVDVDVDDKYTRHDYYTAGIHLIMNAPLSPGHPAYLKAKNIHCTYVFKGKAGFTGQADFTGTMYDSGSGNNTKWHFTIKSPSTNSIANDVLTRKLAEEKYYKGKSVQRQLDNYTAYLNINKKIDKVALQFHTANKDGKGTDSFFAIYILGKKFIISADDGSNFWPKKYVFSFFWGD